MSIVKCPVYGHLNIYAYLINHFVYCGTSLLMAGVNSIYPKFLKSLSSSLTKCKWNYEEVFVMKTKFIVYVQFTE